MEYISCAVRGDNGSDRYFSINKSWEVDSTTHISNSCMFTFIKQHCCHKNVGPSASCSKNSDPGAKHFEVQHKGAHKIHWRIIRNKEINKNSLMYSPNSIQQDGFRTCDSKKSRALILMQCHSLNVTFLSDHHGVCNHGSTETTVSSYWPSEGIKAAYSPLHHTYMNSASQPSVPSFWTASLWWSI